MRTGGVSLMKTSDAINKKEGSKGVPGKQLLSIANLNDALQYAEQDIKDRWQWYKERYIRGLRK
jgi:hypothetical protein